MHTIGIVAMKILIAYDGSKPAIDAIESLATAGFPETRVQATVLSAGEAQPELEPAFNLSPALPIVTYALESATETATYARETAEHEAEEGADLVKTIFPNWVITSYGRTGAPAVAILELAEAMKPDLIVMGSHGRSGLQRMFLGSVSLRVMRESSVSVRITRKAPTTDSEYPPVLLLAYDASEGANRAVHHILDRTWPRHTQLHIVSVLDVSILSSRNYLWLVGDDLQTYEKLSESRIEHAMKSLEHEMRKYFDVTTAVCIGNPVHEILAEAKRVQPDTIFIGSRGLSRLERMLLGSVVQGVASHVETSIEIVK